MEQERQTFKKDERLKSRSIISSLFENGIILHHTPFKVLYKTEFLDNQVFPAQIGISVSKRNFKKAIERNRIKRKIREAYRKNKQILYNALNTSNQKLHFFVIYTSKEDLEYLVIEQEIKQLLNKLIKKIGE